MVITRATLVHQAHLSSPQAPALFAAHGIRPAEKCAVVWDEVSLDEAEMWCHLHELDTLIVELNAVAESTEMILSHRAGSA